MNKEDFYKLKQSDVVYNSKTNEIVVIENCFSPYVRKKSDFVINPKIQKNGTVKMYAKDYWKWHFINDDSPIEIQFEMLKIRHFNLETFVRSRLK